MLYKEPKQAVVKSITKKGLITVFLGELIVCGYAYYEWRKMNRDQDYRRIMYHKSPYILNAFYWTTAKMGTSGIKEADYEAWGVHFNKKVEPLY